MNGFRMSKALRAGPGVFFVALAVAMLALTAALGSGATPVQAAATDEVLLPTGASSCDEEANDTAAGACNIGTISDLLSGVDGDVVNLSSEGGTGDDDIHAVFDIPNPDFGIQDARILITSVATTGGTHSVQVGTDDGGGEADYGSEDPGADVEYNDAGILTAVAGAVGGSVSFNVSLDCSVDPCNVAVNEIKLVITYETVDENPDFPDGCDLDVVLVLDSSGSISRDGDPSEMDQMQGAMETFVSALSAGDPRFAVVDFAEGSEWLVDNGDWYDNETDANTAIESVGSNSLGSLTNWVAALGSAADALANDPRPGDPSNNLVIFASDGDPTTGGDMVDAVMAANHIKTDLETRIVTIGIGDEPTDANLIAISSFDAYYGTDFGSLEDTLIGLLQDNCEQIKCVEGHFVVAPADTPETGGCGSVRICLDGVHGATVSEYDLKHDPKLEDATLGSCPPNEGPPPATPVPPTPVPTQEVEAAVATPTPVAVVESVTPPNTGDGGLMGSGGSSLFVAALGAVGLLSLAALVLRRKDASQG